MRLEGVAGGVPQLRVHGHIGQSIVVEGSDDLKVWNPISTNAAVIGGILLQDMAAAHRPVRFYRARV